MIDPESIKIYAQKRMEENKTFLKGFGKKKKRLLDLMVHDAHRIVFADFNCLECANCCKTLGPRLTDKDVEKLSRRLNIKQPEFIKSYIRVDEDGDMVFNNMPCPFLLPDNYCSVYESRPKACRDYPHTDRVNMFQISSETLKNSLTCPAVSDILEMAKANYNNQRR